MNKTNWSVKPCSIVTDPSIEYYIKQYSFSVDLTA